MTNHFLYKNACMITVYDLLFLASIAESKDERQLWRFLNRYRSAVAEISNTQINAFVDHAEAIANEARPDLKQLCEETGTYDTLRIKLMQWRDTCSQRTVTH